MAPDLQPEGMDEAAADPPLRWLAVAVVGIALAALGVVAVVLAVAGVAGAVTAVVPPLAPLFSLAPLLIVAGVALFGLAMTMWDPDVET